MSSRHARRHKPIGRNDARQKESIMKSALIAAVVAAIVAAGTATAATLVVTSQNIKNGTIQIIDISAQAKRTLKGNRGAPGVRGPAGPAGTPGAQGPPGIQSLQEVLNSVFVPNAQNGNVTATCPPGQQAVSGGAGFSGVITSSHSTGNGWQVSGFNNSGTSTGLAAWAYCSANVTVARAPV
jgi:hypothetical protein